MRSCLGLACLERAREAIRRSVSIGLHSDAKGGIFCVRFSSVDKDLNVTRGLLGLEEGFGTKSADIRQATIRIVERFCGSALACPCSDAEALLSHFREHVVMLDCDGASDEQSSMRLLTGDHDGPAYLQRVKILLRDRTHASRRLPTYCIDVLIFCIVPHGPGCTWVEVGEGSSVACRLIKNPWSADPYVSLVMSTYVDSHESMINTIQHSPDLQRVFKENCRAITGERTPLDAERSRVRNLGFAAHRYDSVTKPLTRFCLLFDGLWATAAEILTLRQGTVPAKRAAHFFAFVGEESLVQLAMLSDAAYEALELVRYHDSECYDLALLPSLIQRFRHNIDTLFLRDNVLQCGHSALMLQHLRTSRTCRVGQSLKAFNQLAKSTNLSFSH